MAAHRFSAVANFARPLASSFFHVHGVALGLTGSFFSSVVEKNPPASIEVWKAIALEP